MDGTKDNVIGVASAALDKMAKTMHSDKITAGAFVIVHGTGHNGGITKHSEDYDSGIPTGVMSSAQ